MIKLKKRKNKKRKEKELVDIRSSFDVCWPLGNSFPNNKLA